MKRQGDLYDSIWQWDNLRRAFWRAAKAARCGGAARKFESDLDANLRALQEDLKMERVAGSGFTRFVIHDPKMRVITAPAFHDRVLHHAIMNVCEPHFERWLVHDSYACRKGKGRLAALKRATCHAARHGWFLKLDIRKYFESIQLDRLLAILERKIKDRRLLDLLTRLLRAGAATDERGLPIGSLLSQHMANFYLGPLDRLCLEHLRVEGYVRYMDDFVLWADDQRHLRECWRQVEVHVRDTLGLELKTGGHLNQTKHGMDFCGFRIFPGWRTLNRRSRRRMASKIRFIESLIDEREQQLRAQAVLAFAKEGSSWHARRRALARASTA